MCGMDKEKTMLQENLVCQYCNKSFERVHKTGLPQKYCYECKYRNCLVCGKKFKRTNQQILNPAWGNYCSIKCSVDYKPHRFKKNGYWCVKAKDHPKAYEKDYYYEHILVMEKHLDRHMGEGEVVHHKDGNKLNNALSNLEVKTRSEHSLHHFPKVSYSEDIGIDHKKHAKFSRNNLHTSSKKREHDELTYNPNNIMANSDGYVSVARKMMSEILGRPLKSHEIVFHKNRDSFDNRPENLVLFHRKKQSYKKPLVKKNRIKGWKVDKKNGYVSIWNPQHPMAAKSGYVLEHRLIMSEHLGRLLNKNEFVHHINGNRADNRVDNLELVSAKEHIQRHLRH